MLELMICNGISISQEAANEFGNFSIQGFQLAAIAWLVDNNHSLYEFKMPAFRAMIEFANPEAAAML